MQKLCRVGGAEKGERRKEVFFTARKEGRKGEKEKQKHKQKEKEKEREKTAKKERRQEWRKAKRKELEVSFAIKLSFCKRGRPHSRYLPRPFRLR